MHAHSRSRSRLIPFVFLSAACVSQSDFNAAKKALTDTQQQLVKCQSDANDERGTLTAKLMEASAAQKKCGDEATSLRAELLELKGFAKKGDGEAAVKTPTPLTLDERIRKKSEHNFECRQKGRGCDLEEMTVEEAQRAPQWKAQERLKLRPKAMRGEPLTPYEQWLLQD